MMELLTTLGVAGISGLITGLITWGGLKKDVDWVKVMLVQHHERLTHIERKN